MDHYTQASELVSELKENLRVGWDDDENLKRYLVRSMSRLDDLIGLPVDYTTDESAKDLLFNRVRYDYNASAEYWLDNFREDIRQLQFKYAVEAMRDD